MYAYARANPMSMFDSEGLVFAGSDCTSQQGEEIKKSEERIRKELAKPCSCDASQAGVRSFIISFDVYVVLNILEKYDNKRPDPICADPLAATDPNGEFPFIVRICIKFPAVCAALAACRVNPIQCVETLCKANNALSRYKIHCNLPGCGPTENKYSLYVKTAAACTCFVNRVFEKYVCNKGKSDKNHDDEIIKAREKCFDCAQKCSI